MCPQPITIELNLSVLVLGRIPLRQRLCKQVGIIRDVDLFLQSFSFSWIAHVHPGPHGMLDRMVQSGNDTVLPAQEVRTRQARSDGVVGDERTVTGQVLHKELQLLQQRRTREQRQPAGAHQYRFALAENLR